MTTTPPRIDPRLGAAALRAPAASMVDSRPQAILKLRPRNSFDYRVRYEPQPIALCSMSHELHNTSHLAKINLNPRKKKRSPVFTYVFHFFLAIILVKSFFR